METHEHSLESLAVRVKHLESALEGLQDAVYRESLLQSRRLEELRRRMDPEQIARDLSDDARRRGI